MQIVARRRHRSQRYTAIRKNSGVEVWIGVSAMNSVGGGYETGTSLMNQSPAREIIVLKYIVVASGSLRRLRGSYFG
jgi:hypothetical protein